MCVFQSNFKPTSSENESNDLSPWAFLRLSVWRVFVVLFYHLCFCLSPSGLCLMFRAEHMGPLNSLVHALFAITLLILTDSCDKRCLGARCWIVGSSGWTAWASVCLLWDRESTLWRKETAHNEKKGPQLTSPHSTHPSVQREAVWPKFTLPHLPRHLFSLLGKHLEKCMRKREKKKRIHMLEYITFSQGKGKPGHLQTYTAL